MSSGSSCACYLVCNMNPLVKKFGNTKRWVNWRFENVGGRQTKVPYFSKKVKSSSTDDKTWKTFEDAETQLDNGSNKFDGIGIVFTPEQNLLGVDIDHCVIEKLIVHEQKESIQNFIDQANTYTEISPSKTGLHLFLEIKGSFTLTANKKAPFEIYTSGRYFTVTQEVYGESKDIRIVTIEEAKQLLSLIGYPWNQTTQTTVNTKEYLTDEQIVDRMFSTKKIGIKIQSLYNGDISEYKNDKSSADYSLLKTLAFWTGNNSSQMERIWLSSPLGLREKTQKRKDYRKKSIDKAISNTKKIYESNSIKVEKEDLDLLFTFDKDGEKVFIQNVENIYRILTKHQEFKSRIRMDIFKNTIEIDGRQLEDSDIIVLQTHLSILFPFLLKVGKELVGDAVIKVAKENTTHPPREYINSLVWDKKYRLDSWLSEAYSTPNDKYHKSVGSNWLKGLVKRLIDPGCKFDYVLVLIGEQGIKKSMSFSTLVGEKWHLEMTDTPDKKDFFEKMRGKIVIEFSEGETLSKTDVKKMKAVITMQTDTYRPSYGRFALDFPRQCVFAMTTNDEKPLKDDTGNRRWLPVECTKEVNIKWIEDNRGQLFAEAYHRVINLKETTWEFPEEETKAMQESRRMEDPNTDIITEWYYGLKEDEVKQGITINRVYKEVLNNNMPSFKPLSSWDQRQIATVLKYGLKLEKRQITINGARQVRWFNPLDSTPMFLSRSKEMDAEEIFSGYNDK